MLAVQRGDDLPGIEVLEGYGPRLGKAKFFFDGRLYRYQLGLTPSREVASNELDRFPLDP